MVSARWRSAGRTAAALVVATAFFGCHKPEPGTGIGSVQLAAMLSGVSPSAVDQITVTITPQGSGDGGGAAAIVSDLTKSSQGWGGLIGHIPAGLETFQLDAKQTGVTIFTGSADVTIVEGQTAAVLVVLQPITSPTPFSDTAPFIDSLTASSAAVSPGDVVSFTAAAHDVDVGDTLTYGWSAPGGTFSTPALTTTQWTAPAAEGSYPVTVTVTDSSGTFRAVSLTVDVHIANGRGAADLAVDFNTWPDVTAFTASAGRVDPLGTIFLAVTANDNDGDLLSYEWSDDCGGTFTGTFTDTSVTHPPWTAPTGVPASGTCTLNVAIADGRGGSNQGHLIVQVGAAPTATIAPIVTAAYQDLTTATVGDTLHFSVQASDPQGGALTYAWSAPAGMTLGTQVDTAGGSSQTATLTAANALNYAVSVTISNGLSTVFVFNVGLGLTNVAIANPSFELPDVPDNSGATPTGWDSGATGISSSAFDPISSMIAGTDGDNANTQGLIPNGGQVLAIFDPGDSGASPPVTAGQTLGDVAISSARYTLSFSYAQRLDLGFEPFTVTLKDGNGAVMLSSSFASVYSGGFFMPVNVAGQVPAGLTGNVRIEFVGNVGSSVPLNTFIDAVSLTVEPYFVVIVTGK